MSILPRIKQCRAACAALFVSVLAACAAPSAVRTEAAVAPPPPPAAVTLNRPEQFERDRAAILAMAGEFRVRFTFEETLSLDPDYTPRKQKRSGATEWVTVIEDRGDFISLQHILVIGEDHSVVKHWRQDWQYQPASVLRYRGQQHWQPEPVAEAERLGAWSQTVFEVDDAPRYGGVGRWRHTDGEVVWESDYSWRPLPRREYTTRDDYQVMGAVNRHLLTPEGWAHEQINTKLVVGAAGTVRPLAREQGLNTYRRITDYDFSAGRTYWQSTASYWARVRALYSQALARPQGLTLGGELDGTPRYAASFELAEKQAEGSEIDAATVASTLRKYWIDG
jgi:hypothetical protein